MQKKLCICGRSQIFPLCDNTHQDEGWSCQNPVVWAPIGFASSLVFSSLALKLGAHFNGVVCESPQEKYQVQKLILLVDSTQLEKPLEIYHQVESPEVLVIVSGEGASLIQNLFPKAQIVNLGIHLNESLFNRVKQLISNHVIKEPEPVSTLRPVFLSHAVQDEALIMPSLDYLKHYYQARFFTCYDSISEGKVWHDEIIRGLKESEMVLVLLSKAMLSSTFCAFEIGYALALEKPLALISLDGATPPAYIQHLQMTDLFRKQPLFPWLNTRDLLIDSMLNIMKKVL